MKKLTYKLLRTFTIYALIVLAASVPAYYFLVDSIWLRELDQHNKVIAAKTETELNNLKLDDNALAQSIQLWDRIQPGTYIQEIEDPSNIKDSIYTITKENNYLKHKGIDRFRGLVETIHINGKAYLLTVETNVEETEETVLFIAIVTFVFFLILVLGFLLLNKRLSVQLWKPFRNNLTKLQSFNLNQQTNIEFEKSNTVEFEELNEALNKLITQNISVYKTQKEFTDNASHELQTPLAIIKNKLDLILQHETLTDRQYQIIEDIHIALTRISRTNKNLLLLARMENMQFDNHEMINVSLLTQQCLEQLTTISTDKDISIEKHIEENVILNGNKTLIEILLNNLLLNAIRHNLPNGAIVLHLSKETLQISNTGTNVLKEEKLFKRFANTNNEYTGSGLGLSIIKEICNYNNWAIQYHFENKLHQFSIRF